jgi:hypothetical protein
MDRPSSLETRRSALLALASTVAVAALIPVYRLQDLSWPSAAVASAMFVIPCVLLGLVAWRRLLRTNVALSLGWSLVVHAAAALAFSAAWTLVFTALVYWLRPDGIGAFLQGGAVWQLAWGVILYVGLVLVARAHVRAKEREIAAANAELQALRAQLNPHFLFNTLHSLAQLAREDPAATQEALERFGDLMRYVLSAGRTSAMQVPLEEELRFVRNYLAVEALRLGERLRVIERIDEETLELGVPPLLLQPLVENAVRHGIAPRRAGGTLRLTVQLVDATLAIEVADDGNGDEPEAWRHASGLGLKSVCRQLNACFPGAAQLRVSTQPRAGFVVNLEMPARLPAAAHA